VTVLFLVLAACAGAGLTALAWWVLGQPRLVLWLLVLALPWGVRDLAGGLQLAQLLSAAAAGAAGVAALARAGTPLHRPGPLLWATALVASAFASVITATDPGTSLRAAITYAVGLALAWSVA
jgi:hypothetical protein